MAEFSVNTDVLDELAAKLDGITTEQLPRIDRAGLRAVGSYAKEVLEYVTPMAEFPPTPHSNALPQGALKESVRARTVKAESTGWQAEVVDFGKNNYVANFVDGGTAHAAAYPFIRRLQDEPAFQNKAQEAYMAAVEAEVEKVLSGF